jgi:hypothetical protein
LNEITPTDTGAVTRDGDNLATGSEGCDLNDMKGVIVPVRFYYNLYTVISQNIDEF